AFALPKNGMTDIFFSPPRGFCTYSRPTSITVRHRRCSLEVYAVQRRYAGHNSRYEPFGGLGIYAAADYWTGIDRDFDFRGIIRTNPGQRTYLAEPRQEICYLRLCFTEWISNDHTHTDPDDFRDTDANP